MGRQRNNIVSGIFLLLFTGLIGCGGGDNSARDLLNLLALLKAMENDKPGESHEPPVIDSVSPLFVSPNDSIVISGKNYDPVTTNNTVHFSSNVPGYVQAATSTQLTIIVPQGAATGTVEVIVDGRSAISAEEVDVGPRPRIDAVVPHRANIGETVRIDGEHFPDDLSDLEVNFNGVGVAVSDLTIIDENTIEAVVPTGATTGPVSLTANQRPAVSPENFAVVRLLENIVDGHASWPEYYHGIIYYTSRNGACGAGNDIQSFDTNSGVVSLITCAPDQSHYANSAWGSAYHPNRQLLILLTNSTGYSTADFHFYVSIDPNDPDTPMNTKALPRELFVPGGQGGSRPTILPDGRVIVSWFDRPGSSIRLYDQNYSSYELLQSAGDNRFWGSQIALGDNGEYYFSMKRSDGQYVIIKSRLDDSTNMVQVSTADGNNIHPTYSNGLLVYESRKSNGKSQLRIIDAKGDARLFPNCDCDRRWPRFTGDNLVFTDSGNIMLVNPGL